jgi:hypothetical protein
MSNTLTPRYEPFRAQIQTSGTGLHSYESRIIETISCCLYWVNSQQCWGELRVYFNTKDWPVQNLGFICTDPTFLQGIKHNLKLRELVADGIEYSELAFQGHDFVCFDVDSAFISSWNSLFEEE